MSKVVQDQKSFSMGQVSPSALAKFGNEYYASCKKLSNCVVNVDGSVQLRPALRTVNILPLSKDIRDVACLEDGGKKFFFYFTFDASQKGLNEVNWTNDKDQVQGRLNKMDFNGNVPSDLGLEIDDKGEIVRIKKVSDKVVVFFEKSYPWKIVIEGGIPKAYPFFYDKEDPKFNNIWQAFPCSRTVQVKDWGKMIVKTLNWEGSGDVGTCDIKFTNAPEGLDLRGHPISFSIRDEGNNDIRVDEDDPEIWKADFKRSADFMFNDLSKSIDDREDSSNPVGVFGNNFSEASIVSRTIDESHRSFMFPLDNTTLLGFRYGDSMFDRKIYSFTSSSTTVRNNLKSLRVSLEHSYLDIQRVYYYDDKYVIVKGGVGSLLEDLNFPNVFNRKPKVYGTFLIKYNVSGALSDSDIVLLERNGYLPSHTLNIGLDFNRFYVNSSETTLYLWKKNDSKVRKISLLSYNMERDGLISEYERSETIYFKRSFDQFYADEVGNGYYISKGKYLFKLDSIGDIVSDSSTPSKFYIFKYDHTIRKIKSDGVYSWDDKTIYHDSFPVNFTHSVDDPETVLDVNTTDREDEAEKDIKEVKAKQVFAGIGFRFFTAFPTGLPVNGYMPCKLYSIGIKTNGGNKSNSLSFGGSNFDGDVKAVNEKGEVLENDDTPVPNLAGVTDNFVVSDWFDGWPKDGGNVAGKDFYLTNGGKLSYSKVDRRYQFGAPIKVLLNSSGLFYFIGDVKYSEILKEDFHEDYRTEPITKFWERVDKEEESVVFNLGDPFTYTVQTLQGEKVNFLNFTISEIGAFASAGAQSVAMTDKGVFYWGINSRPLDASSFINLGKVSEFRGSKDYKAIVEVLDRLYLTDAFGDLFVVTYNQQNRNFLAVPCGTSVDCRRVNSGIPFYGNRVLFVDSGTNRLYSMNSMDRGMLGGVSEWECNDESGNCMTFDRVERFGNDYYVLGRLMGQRHLLKVDRNFDRDNVLGVEVQYSGLG